ncbi:TrmH family RNA methyltransferase [Melghiribacillus thermohalophilus]|uniref:TrmH family RNA methyltransferase n=1 Tax=Melghiribacillus thermohalophilus TaxID=1324956 RepID=A0A4R3ND16_9BACI|nr:RNA methyltransferase [Melghiribacillus thermohalophilus]TCT25039.1 TrmH family RNA methyltransferase [Melghiribacillus thermohalophilus]
MIQSIQNGKVKKWNKLKKKKWREKTQTFLVEGPHLIEEANKSSWPIKELILTEDFRLGFDPGELPVFRVSDEIMSYLSDTETSQGILAVCEMKEIPFRSSFKRVLMLDRVQDPGNAGTIVRTADAMGFDAVIFGKGTVDVYNEKTIRATQGSLFHLPVYRGDLPEWSEQLKKLGFSIWATAIEEGKPFQSLQVPDALGIVFGNEGEGVQEKILTIADERVYIPMKGKAESLNVSIAGGILMYYLQAQA